MTAKIEIVELQGAGMMYGHQRKITQHYVATGKVHGIEGKKSTALDMASIFMRKRLVKNPEVSFMITYYPKGKDAED